MPKQTQQATQALQKDLSTTARKSGDVRAVVIGRRGNNSLEGNLTVVPSQFRRYSVAELYQRFLINAPDHKGNYNCGFGQYGRNLSVSANYNFGDLILPGIITANVEGKVKGDVAKEVLFMIHRAAPTALFSQDEKKQLKPVWTTGKPVVFCVLSGLTYQIVANLNALSGVKVGFSSVLGNSTSGGAEPETDALQLDISIDASIKAGAGLSGQLIRLAADQSGFYPNGTGNELVEAFSNALGGPSAKDLASEVATWFEYVMTYLQKDAFDTFQPIVQNLAAQINPTDKIKEIYDQVKQGLLDKITNKGGVQTLAKNLFDFLKNKAASEIQTEATLQLLDKLSKELSDFYQKQMLHSLLTTPKPTNNIWIRTSPQKVQINYREIQRQIAWYQNIKKSKQSTTVNLPGVLPLEQELCHADLYSFVANTQAGGTASGKASLKTSAGGASAGASGAATIAGDVKFSSSRYQICIPSSSPSEKPLVLTQDTFTTYRRMAGKASWGSSANIFLEDYGLEANQAGKLENRFFDLITYQCISAYWLYPRKENNPSPATLEMGSGTSFGCSVNLKHLQRMAAPGSPSQKPDPIKQLKQQLATSLHISEAELDIFLSKAFPSGPPSASGNSNPKNLLENYTTVILESNFAFLPGANNNISLQNAKNADLYRPDDLFTSPSIKSILSQLDGKLNQGSNPATPPCRLDSIRIRVRNEDNLGNYDNSHPIFTLGFDFRAAVKIEYGKTQKASGNEGIFDVYTCWFNPDYEVRPQDGYERSVPSAVLLPHTLFEKADSNPIKE
ncbi:MAG: hypothetical protein H6563_14000 [Lewinellaceae bacterium]|nr:hypothetical protein [Lewinellaceae bacterium]